MGTVSSYLSLLIPKYKKDLSLICRITSSYSSTKLYTQDYNLTNPNLKSKEVNVTTLNMCNILERYRVLTEKIIYKVVNIFIPTMILNEVFRRIS